MGIRVIGRENGDTKRFRVSPRVDSDRGQSDAGKPAIGGDAIADGDTIDAANGDEQRSANVTAGFVDTSTVGDDTGGGSGDLGFGFFSNGKPRKRAPNGTRRSGGSRDTRRDTSKTTDDIASYLATGHLFISKILKMPQFTVSEDEAKQLAEATVRVTQLYDMGLGTEEQRAWVNLALVAGNIYIPKIFEGPKKGSTLQVVPKRENQGVTPMPDFMVNGSGTQVN